MSYSPQAIKVGSRISQIRIHHTAFKEALDGVGRVIQLGNNLQHPVGACVIAPSGAGKSFLIESVQHNVCNWSFLRPESVLVASLKEAPTVAQIQEELLAAFKYAISPRTGRKTNATLFNVLVAAIEQHDIQLIAIDEYQHVFLSRKDEARVAINDWIKRLMTVTSRPVLLSGTDQLRIIEKADPQLTTRISSIFQLPSLKDKDWLGVLNGFVTGTTDIDLSELNNYAKPMFNATEGVMRTLKGLIIETAMVAVDANATKVEKEHLKLAFQRLVGTGSSKSNPFA
ncbi:TniB family NTP-binding protein [Ralstonia pseudosolanacearum]|uniref:TniB family NTP-binding protein n=1 Tax=Ralstonia pseudosolanacearum TaxID=1310165 RepID=UPI001FF89D54|nr:TniB family NTP-binding protein [Ralstonia pseudosolanacearum]